MVQAIGAVPRRAHAAMVAERPVTHAHRHAGAAELRPILIVAPQST
jgi:hypothetical protein